MTGGSATRAVWRLRPESAESHLKVNPLRRSSTAHQSGILPNKEASGMSTRKLLQLASEWGRVCRRTADKPGVNQQADAWLPTAVRSVLQSTEQASDDSEVHSA